MTTFPQRAPLRLKAITLRGIGPYLHGTRLDIRPLTILCGTNGSGKSTWIRALEAVEKGLPSLVPFGLEHGGEEGELTHASLAWHLFGQDSMPESLGSAEEFGPPGTIGLVLETTGAELGREDSSIDTRFSSNAFTRLVSCRSWQRKTEIQVFLSDGRFTCMNLECLEWPFERGFELRVGAFRVVYRQEERGKPGTFHASRSILTCDENDTELVRLAQGDVDRIEGCFQEGTACPPIGAELFRCCVRTIRNLLRRLFLGYFHIGAIRKIVRRSEANQVQAEEGVEQEDENEDWLEDRTYRHSRAVAEHIARRYVGASGAYTHDLYGKFFLNRMGSPCSSDHDPEFDLAAYYGDWMQHLVKTGVAKESIYPSSATLGSKKPTPGGFLLTFSPLEMDPYNPKQIESYDFRRYTSRTFEGAWLGIGPEHMSAGFHQVAPVVMQAGLMKQFELCSVENPEVHLHPSLQGDLAEYLVGEAWTGKCFLVETHSDLVVRRVLRAILEEDISQEAVRLYFTEVEKSEVEFRDSYSTLTALEINDRGQIDNWPDGFMDADTLEARRLIAAVYGKRGEEIEGDTCG